VTLAWCLDPPARERFRALAALLGAGGSRGLEAWLAEQAQAPGGASGWNLPGPEGLRRLGLLELAGLAAWLERGPRWELLARLRSSAGRGLPRGGRRLPGWALHSLRACLLCPPPGAPGWLERAGLHRLARALADRRLGALSGLGPGERAVLCAVHAGLAAQPAARREAGRLRLGLGLGG